MALELTTLSDFKLYLRKTSLTDDTMLTNILTAIEEKIFEYCGVEHIIETEYTEYYDGNYENTLFVKYSPITTVTAVYDDPNRVYSAATLIPATDYVVYNREGKITLVNSFLGVQSIFGRNYMNIKAIYKAGYVTIPTSLKLATWKWGKIVYDEWQESSDGINQRTIGDKTLTWRKDEIPIEIKLTLNKYVHYNYRRQNRDI